MIHKFLIFISLFLSVTTKAAFEPQQFRMGITTGVVFLMSDVGDDAGNANGLGLNLSYQMDPEWAIEAQYVRSSHDNLKHSETAFGLNYYFTDDPIFLTYANFGVNFVSHEVKVPAVPTTLTFDDSGFGVFAGIGMDFLLTENVAAGIQARYNKMFELNARISGGGEVAIIQDFATLFVRLSYIFN